MLHEKIIMVGRMDFTGFNARKGGRCQHVLMVYHSAYPHVRGGIDAMISAMIGELTATCRVSLFSPGDWSVKALQVEWHGAVAGYRLRLRMPWDANRPVRGFLGWLWEFPRTLWQLHRFLRTEKVDLIHLHTVRDYQFYFRLLRWLGGPPYILTFHGTDALNFAQGTLLGVQGERKDAVLLRWVATGAAAVTSVSAHYARLIQQHHPQLGQIEYIPNGIPLQMAETSGTLSLALPARYWVVVGWIEPPKGQDVAVRAWGMLSARFPDLHLLIVGAEPLLGSGLPYYPGYKESIEQLIIDLNIKATVHLTHSLPRSELMSVIRQAEGLVFPSLREGRPYVLLEAGLSKLPVVCGDIPAFADVITHEQDGLLTPSGDAQALADAVARVASDALFANGLGEALHATVCRDYSAQSMTTGYLALYHRVVES